MNSMENSWVDDIPKCTHSGVGIANNQVYKADGQRNDGRENQDRVFRFKTDDDIYLYGVFDGHGSSKASEFARQRIPAELLLGQLSYDSLDEEVKATLHAAFMCVENVFKQSLEDELAHQASLKMQLPDGLTDFEICAQYPEIARELNRIEQEIQCGTTGVLALIIGGKLFVANVGNCRALLCKLDANGVLRVTQLSVDHTWSSNSDEQFRLRQLGVGEGALDITRSIGDYQLKGGYGDNEKLRDALHEPVIAEPDIQGGVPIDESCRFLMLMSAGLVRCWEEATDSEHPNADIAGMVTREFPYQQTLFGVTQAVVDQIVRRHHDKAMSGAPDLSINGHDDLTLLVRNFHQPLGGGVSASATTPSPRGATPFFTRSFSHYTGSTLSDERTATSSTQSSQGGDGATGAGGAGFVAKVRGNASAPSIIPSMRSRLPLDQSGRVPAYVDFSAFYEAVKSSGEHVHAVCSSGEEGSDEAEDEEDTPDHRPHTAVSRADEILLPVEPNQYEAETGSKTSAGDAVRTEGVIESRVKVDSIARGGVRKNTTPLDALSSTTTDGGGKIATPAEGTATMDAAVEDGVRSEAAPEGGGRAEAASEGGVRAEAASEGGVTAEAAPEGGVRAETAEGSGQRAETPVSSECEVDDSGFVITTDTDLEP